jgi:hypothetical protein
MDIEKIRDAISTLKDNKPTHSWTFRFKDGADATAAVHREVREGVAYAVCSCNGKPGMVFRADRLVEGIVAIVTQFRAPNAVQDEAKGLWAQVQLGTEAIWLNTTSRGGKVNGFCVPLEQVEGVLKLFEDVA